MRTAMVIRYRLGTRMLFTDHADLPIRAIGVIRGFPVAAANLSRRN
jgi:hypothetical protein